MKKLKTADAVAVILILVLLAAVGKIGYSVSEQWAREAAEAAAKQRAEEALKQQIAECERLLEDVVNEGPSFQQWKEGVLRDPWGEEVVVVESDGSLPRIDASSAGPDKVPGTPDDISTYRRRGVNLKAAGESFGRSVTDFGIGSAKGAFKSVKDHWSGNKEGKK